MTKPKKKMNVPASLSDSGLGWIDKYNETNKLMVELYAALNDKNYTEAERLTLATVDALHTIRQVSIVLGINNLRLPNDKLRRGATGQLGERDE